MPVPLTCEVLGIFTQAVQTDALKGPDYLTYTRVLCAVTMADLQMKLLRKKIQKRNEKTKERKLLSKQREEEDSGKCR